MKDREKEGVEGVITENLGVFTKFMFGNLPHWENLARITPLFGWHTSLDVFRVRP